MAKYIARRLIMSLITIWLIITLVFFMMRLMPGGPFTGERAIPPQVLENMKARFGLDKPLFEQYTMYMGGLLKGDMGPMMKRPGKSVSENIAQLFPTSAKLGGVAVLFAVGIGMALGIIAAFNRGKFLDRLVMIIATIGISIPGFVIALLLLLYLAVQLKLLPVMGLTTPKHYIMPALALSGSSIAFIARLTRSRLLDVIKSDYIRTAKAKGLTNLRVILGHALRNTLIPIVTYIGPLIAGVLTGSFAIEGIFAIPGLGREFVTSINQRDYTMLLGVIIFYSVFLVLINFVIDILYVVIDPRINIDGGAA